MERLNCVRQLVFSRTRLEFRLLWNKIFHKEDEELGWLLNPYKRSQDDYRDATMMETLGRNVDGPSYQYSFDEFRGNFKGEGVTIYNRSVAKKGDRNNKTKKGEKKSFAETALQVARYMGMGVYMTSTAFPSPLMPVDDNHLYDENYFGPQNIYSMSKIW